MGSALAPGAIAPDAVFNLPTRGYDALEEPTFTSRHSFAAKEDDGNKKDVKTKKRSHSPSGMYSRDGDGDGIKCESEKEEKKKGPWSGRDSDQDGTKNGDDKTPYGKGSDKPNKKSDDGKKPRSDKGETRRANDC